MERKHLMPGRGIGWSMTSFALFENIAKLLNKG
jgi:hypothetical protein